MFGGCLEAIELILECQMVADHDPDPKPPAVERIKKALDLLWLVSLVSLEQTYSMGHIDDVYFVTTGSDRQIYHIADQGNKVARARN
jgi:hypothetical protein